jgi:AcrR family transcriptional regulator
MTFYRHFPSKDDLVLAFLKRREQLWTEQWLEAAVMERAGNPTSAVRAASAGYLARKWHILMKGCIVAAGEGDRLAARRARAVAELLLKSEIQAR